PPDYLSVLRSLASNLFSFSSAFPLLNDLSGDLNMTLPLIGKSLGQLLGIQTQKLNGTSVAGVNGFDALQALLQSYGVSLDITPANAAQVLSAFIHGQNVDLLHFHFTDASRPSIPPWKIPLFEFPILDVVNIHGGLAAGV